MTINTVAQNPTVSFYKSKPVRVAFYEDGPWFHALDICTALELEIDDTQTVETITRAAPDYCRGYLPLEPDDGSGPALSLALSPVGVWFVAEKYGYPPLGPKVAAWCRREAEALAPNAPHDDPRMHLALMADGSMPPYPDRYSGRRSEWEALRYSNTYLKAATLRYNRKPSAPAIVRAGMPASFIAAKAQ